jgi:hypothetical protein
MPLPQSIIEFGQALKRGYKTGEQIMQEAGDTAVHSIFNPAFGKTLAAGTPGKKIIQDVEGVPRPVQQPGRQAVTAQTNPVEFAGAYAARLITDLGTDQSRRYWWKYNNPIAISQQIITKAGKVGEQVQQMTPTQKGLLGLATMTPIAASMGIYDITNPGELFRPKGFAQQYAEPGSEDRRETTQPAEELFERFFLQRQGQPLKYETAKQDIPGLTPQRYGDYMRTYYQDKGLLNLGVLKATTENLQGVPEARLLGFPITIPSVAATVGAATGLAMAGRRGVSPNRTILAGLAGSTGGAAIGNVVNEIIAMANRPKLPDLHEYEQQYSSIPIDPTQQNIR